MNSPNGAPARHITIFISLYDAAMLSFTSYTKIGLRLATFLGFICSFLSFVVAIVYTVMKLTHWYNLMPDRRRS